jgi:hypothetical protein
LGQSLDNKRVEVQSDLVASTRAIAASSAANLKSESFPMNRSYGTVPFRPSPFGL